MSDIIEWTVHAVLPKTIGEPYTGNLYVRFDEGGGIKPPPLLYRLIFLFNLENAVENDL